MAETNRDGRYSYWRVVTGNDILLLRDDGYRFYFFLERNKAREEAGMPPQEGLDEWVFMAEYKQCEFGRLADLIVKQFLSALEPAPLNTIDPKLLENT